MFSKKKLMLGLLQTSAMVGISMGVAYAQDDEVSQIPAEESQDEVTEESGQDVVTITGSRIKRDAFSSDAPIDVFEAEAAQLEGIADVGSLLRTATIASGSPQVTAATASSFVTEGGPGAETISLRGLGANRTLVLLNGRRAGPAGTRGQVAAFDLNVIPLSAVDRIEILKDGASSIYGSDAVAGVVNIITKQDDGGSIDAFAMTPQEDGGEELRFSGSWGTSWDRGRMRLTGDYYKREELARGDRDFYQCGNVYAFNDDGSRADLIDPRTGEYQCQDLLWGHVWVYDYASLFTADGDTNVPDSFPYLAQYDYDGSLAANGLPTYPNQGAGFPYMSTPEGWYPVYYDQGDIDGLPSWDGINVGRLARQLVNYDHPFQDQETFIPETERYTAMLEGSYDLTDSLEAYGEVLLNRRETYYNGYRQYWTYIYNGDPSLFGYADPMADGWTGAQWFSPTAITDHSDSSQKVDYARVVAGLTGDFGARMPSWTWDLSAQYSKSSSEYTNDFIYDDAISDQWFRTSLCAGTTTSVAGRPCVDVDWLSPELLAGNPTEEEANFLFGTETGTTDYTQLTVEGYVSGDLITLPAGTVAGAFGFLYQEDEIEDTPGEATLAGNAWGSSSAGITAGKQDTTALYGEVSVPLLSNKPLIESLDITASGRWTDVSTYGDDTTYKVGLNWQVTPSVRLRATQGTSFRTPALFELYLADQSSFASQRSIDPCIQWADALEDRTISQTTADNCAADGIPADFSGGSITATVITGGGLGVLDAETAENFTAGLVWTPDFADLSVALDYFEIEVDSEVSQLGAGTIVAGCYSSEDFANEPLCDLFDRAGSTASPPLLITEVRDSYININSQTNRGIDLTVRYGHDLPFGRLTVDAQATHQIEDTVQLLAEGLVQDYNGEAGDPKTTAQLDFNLETNSNWSFYYGIDFFDQTSNADRFFRVNGANGQTYLGDPVTYKLRTEAIFYHAASATYEFGEGWRMTGGVANIFDEQPPYVTTISGQYSTAGTSAFYSQYDPLGRRFYLSVGKDF